MKAHQGIQEKQLGMEFSSCLSASRAIPVAIEPQCTCADHVDPYEAEIESAIAGHSLDALAHDRQCIVR
jgi:hypothetical protein